MFRRFYQFSIAQRLLLLILCSVVPVVLLAGFFFVWGPFPLSIYVSISIFGVYYVALMILFARRLIIDPIHYSSNLIHGIQAGDYASRMRANNRKDVLAELFREINSLAAFLQDNRYGDVEENKRFQLLIDSVEAGVFVFDDSSRLLIANRAGALFFDKEVSDLLGLTDTELGLDALDVDARDLIVPLTLPNIQSRFLVNSSCYRQGGASHRLLLLTDLADPLREEERMAWKRLIRVISHEINNSLTPITSLADSLTRQLDALPESSHAKDQMREALTVISRRSQNLVGFINDYVRLAKLPPAQREMQSLKALIVSVVNLEWGHEVAFRPALADDFSLAVDRAQIEQALINVIQNAVDASPEGSEPVELSLERHSNWIEIKVLDNGLGLANPDNVFVPFYSTKKKGSGIGLALTRSIIENHHGEIMLKNRQEKSGCHVLIRLPAEPASSGEKGSVVA